MKTLRKTVIAHVDDDPIILDMIRLILSQNEKFELKSYNTGEEFLRSITSINKPDILIVDYFLNSKIPTAMSGKDLISIFRNRGDNIPIIVISSQKKLEVALDLIKLHVADYIEKTGEFTTKIMDSVEEIINIKGLKKEQNHMTKFIEKDTRHLITVIGALAIISISSFIVSLI